MVRCGHGLPKVSPGPAMPYPSMACGQAIPEAIIQSFQGWPARRACGLQPSSTLFDTPCRTPMGESGDDCGGKGMGEGRGGGTGQEMHSSDESKKTIYQIINRFLKT
jgi:hypothetical protein